MSASVGNALLLVGAPVALMEELQTIVLPENTRTIPQHQAFSKKFKVSNTRALSLTPWNYTNNNEFFIA